MERRYARDCDTLFVITGQISESDNYIKDRIRIPDWFYKTAIGVKHGKIVISQAWLYRNTDQPQQTYNCMKTVHDIESMINRKLYPGFWFYKEIH